jgi:hypothetical protein
MISTPWYKGIGEAGRSAARYGRVDFYIARRPPPLDGAETVNLAEGRMASQSPFGDKSGNRSMCGCGQKHLPCSVTALPHDANRRLTSEDFNYNQEADISVCPAGKVLGSTGTLVNDGATLLYRAGKHDCDACELKPRCCPKMPARKVPRSIYENARDVARDIAKTEAYVTSRRERKKIEMLFAHLKHILRLDRLRLRGPFGARDEFLLAATVQNLRKLVKLVPLPTPMPA